MLNINELESRWLRYKIKSYIPHLSIFISFIVLLSITLIYFNKEKSKEDKLESIVEHNKSEKLTIVFNTKETKPKNIQIIEETPVKKEIKNIPLNDVDTIRTLTPSMNFIKEMQNSSQPDYENNDNSDFAFQTKKEEKKSIQTASVEDTAEDIIEEVIIENTIEAEPQNTVTNEEASKKISIHRQNVQSDIHGIIKRFKKNKNPALSLFIAKKYYELGDYHNAYNYALITNGINSDIEASWIVFAKSLVKLGKKEMAIKTLQDYIKQSQSYSGKLLLDEILSGKFE